MGTKQAEFNQQSFISMRFDLLGKQLGIGFSTIDCFQQILPLNRFEGKEPKFDVLGQGQPESTYPSFHGGSVVRV